MTLPRMNTLFLEELASIERILAGKSGKAAKEITDWYRNLAATWDEKERTATAPPPTTTVTSMEGSTTGALRSLRTTTLHSTSYTSTTGSPTTGRSTQERHTHAPPVMFVNKNTDYQEWPSRSTEERPLSSVGMKAHVEFMRTAYDKEENARRQMSANNLNHKLQFTAEMIQEDIRKNFNRVVEQICNIQSRQLETWWSLLRIDDTKVIRTIIRREDIIAHFVGYRVVSVTQCSRFSVTQIHTQHGVNGTCNTNIPVTTEDGQLMFHPRIPRSGTVKPDC